MSDLAQSIVDLGKAAQARRGARRSLEEATSTVAAAIRKQLRRGDSAAVEMKHPELTFTVTYHVERFTDDQGHPIEALCREQFVLERVKGELTSPDSDRLYFPADTAIRLEFTREAAHVVAAFRDQLTADAQEVEGAARTIAKVAVK